MSVTKNKCVRCDWCGKLSRHDLGEYEKPDGSAGYIHSPDWERNPDGSYKPGCGHKDICEECEANETQKLERESQVPDAGANH